MSASPLPKKRRRGTATPPDADARAGLLGEALHLLKRSQAVGESGIEALSGEGEGGVQELDNNIVGADATIKAWRFMQVGVLSSSGHAKFQYQEPWCCDNNTSNKAWDHHDSSEHIDDDYNTNGNINK